MSSSVVDDWIKYHAENRKGSDPLFAACEEVDGLVRLEPEQAWTLILKLVEAAPDDRILASVAAGPLEDLLNNWPNQFIDRVEVQARLDPKFRRCLTGVWGLSGPIRERLTKYTSTIKDPL